MSETSTASRLSILSGRRFRARNAQGVSVEDCAAAEVAVLRPGGGERPQDLGPKERQRHGRPPRSFWRAPSPSGRRGSAALSQWRSRRRRLAVGQKATKGTTGRIPGVLPGKALPGMRVDQSSRLSRAKAHSRPPRWRPLGQPALGAGGRGCRWVPRNARNAALSQSEGPERRKRRRPPQLLRVARSSTCSNRRERSSFPLRCRISLKSGLPASRFDRIFGRPGR